jgi:GDP-L-fucose synthase
MKEEYLLTNELEYTNEPYAIAKIAGIKMCESYNIQYGTNFISVMPTNLYGPNDNFDLEKSHVLPALVRKIHLGKCLETNNWDEITKDLNKRPIEGVNGSATKEDILKVLNKYGIKLSDNKVTVEIWGSGKPLREFLWSEEMADACVFVMENVNFSDLSQDKSEIRNTHINIGTGEEISIKDLAELVKNTIGFSGELYFNISKPDGTMRKLTDPSKLNNLGWKHNIEIQVGISKIHDWYTKQNKK